MKKRDLLLGMGILSAFGLPAASPYQGAPIPVEGSGDFYMFQVESGKWMQANQGHLRDKWTTHAALGNVGFDLEVIKIDGGYQLNPKFGANHSIAGGNDRFYMDTGQPVTVWEITPKTGTSNGYQIKAVGGEGNPDPSLLGEADGKLNSYAEENNTWQFVTRQERIDQMKAEAASKGEADATWLIPGQDFGRNDSRAEFWKLSFSGSPIVALGGLQCNAVREAWNNASNYVHYIVLEGIPNGTYKLNVQGYYRDGKVEDVEFQQRMADGKEVQRAIYFAGAAENKLMPLSGISSDTEVADQYTYNCEVASRWVPNNLDNAANLFMEGKGTNSWIEAVVTDGTLILGIAKEEGIGDDWLVYDNFQLKYVSSATPAADLTSVKAQLAEAIAKAEKLPSTPAIAAAVAAAKEAKEGANATAIRLALYNLYKIIGGVESAKDVIEAFNATKVITDSKGIDVSSAVDMFNAAETRDDFVAALRQMRFLRRAAVAPRHADVFPGHAPAAGEFYLYNVGKKQFLCGGSDWGAHAALGLPGVLLTLEEEDAAAMLYHFDTGLYNGTVEEGKHYLNSRGYMDAPKGGPWQFLPVAGKENVFNIVQGDWPDAYMVWDPYASVDGGHANETTVNTECRSPKFEEGMSNPNAQWKLVTREERDALLENASLENPADATHAIVCPGFNQREPLESAWTINNGTVWERGSNHDDFCLESWNTTDFDASQMVEGLPAGVYTLWANGFYRNGAHREKNDGEIAGQPDLEQISNAYIYAGAEGETYLPNILSESGNAPGEGNTTTSAEGVSYHIPEYCDQAANFFRSGLYQVHFTFEKGDGEVIIGVGKEQQGAPEDWVVVDNFRLSYYGADTTVDAVEKKIEDEASVETVIAPEAVTVEDNRIFNLQGIQVDKAVVPGIYIQNGKKFVVR